MATYFDKPIFQRIARFMGSPLSSLNLRGTCRVARAAIKAPAHYANAEEAMYGMARAGDYEGCVIARDLAIVHSIRELGLSHIRAGTQEYEAFAVCWIYNNTSEVIEQCTMGGHPTMAPRYRAWTTKIYDDSMVIHIVRGLLRGGFYDLARDAFLTAHYNDGGGPLTELQFINIYAHLISGFISFARIRELFEKFVDTLGHGEYDTWLRRNIIRSMITSASEANRADVVAFLIDHSDGIDFDDDFIQGALNKGNIAICRMIDAHIEHPSRSYIGKAACSGAREMCEYARARTDMFAFDMMMFCAVVCNRVEICKLAREWLDDSRRRGVSVDYGQLSDFPKASLWKSVAPNHYASSAAFHGSIDTLMLMIEWGANKFDDMLENAIKGCSRSYHAIRAIRDHVTRIGATINMSRAVSLAKYEGDAISYLMMWDWESTISAPSK